jgi:hypothetical protein
MTSAQEKGGPIVRSSWNYSRRHIPAIWSRNGISGAYSQEDIKQHLLQNTGCVLAIPVWNDPDAQRRAENLGAKALVDKANLYGDLNRWIKSLCTSE